MSHRFRSAVVKHKLAIPVVSIPNGSLRLRHSGLIVLVVANVAILDHPGNPLDIETLLALTLGSIAEKVYGPVARIETIKALSRYDLDKSILISQ